MRQYIRQLIGLLVAGVALASCQNEQPSETPAGSIELSQSELSFDRSAGMQEVNVKVCNRYGDAIDWIYSITPQVEWLTVTPSDNKLAIATTENLSSKERHATVSVISDDNMVRHITVSQKGTDLQLDLSELSDDKLQLPSMGGAKYLQVIGGEIRWDQITASEEWLEIIPLQDSQSIKLAAPRNHSTEPRQAIVTLKKPDASELIVTVEQAGQLEYFVPYQESHKYMAYKDLVAYEEARGFKVVQIQFGDSDFGSPDALLFETSSQKLPEINYFHSLDSHFVYDYVKILLSDPKEFQEGGGYLQYLKDLGYKERYNSKPDSPKLLSPDGFLVASLFHETRYDEFYVRFNPQYLPDKPLPTFDKLPVYTDEIQKRIYDLRVKFKDISAWEKSLGSKVLIEMPIGNNDPQHSDEMWAAIYQTNHETDVNKQEFRFYEFHLSLLRATPEELQSVRLLRLCYNDYERVIFETSPGQFRTTPEFEALAESEGFIFYGINMDGVNFVNKEKGLKMVVMMYVDPNTFGAEKTATIRYEKLPQESGTSAVATNNPQEPQETLTSVPARKYNTRNF